MAITLTYDPQLSRVRITADLLGATATYAVIDRTTDDVRFDVVRGGAAAAVSSEQLTLPVDDYEFPPSTSTTYRIRSFDAGDVLQAEFTDQITAELAAPWVKSIIRPFLNQSVVVQDFSEVRRRSRGASFDVVGRSFPVAVTDVRGGREFELRLYAATETEHEDLDLMEASGDPVFLHVPPGEPSGLPGGYFTIGSTRQNRTTRITHRRVHSWPLVEVAAPAPEVVGVHYTCQAVLNDYATVADMLAAVATIADLLENVADAQDVIVP